MTPRIAAVGMVVADMGRSLEFYRRFGLDIPAEADSQPHVEAELAPGVRLLWDTLDTIRSFDPDYELPGVSQVALAVECDSPSAVDAMFKELVSAGYHGEREPWDAVWGQRYATVRDPDGNDVDLYAALPSADG